VGIVTREGDLACIGTGTGTGTGAGIGLGFNFNFKFRTTDMDPSRFRLGLVAVSSKVVVVVVVVVVDVDEGGGWECKSTATRREGTRSGSGDPGGSIVHGEEAVAAIGSGIGIGIGNEGMEEECNGTSTLEARSTVLVADELGSGGIDVGSFGLCGFSGRLKVGATTTSGLGDDVTEASNLDSRLATESVALWLEDDG
jgi:hypothetical protein